MGFKEQMLTVERLDGAGDCDMEGEQEAEIHGPTARLLRLRCHCNPEPASR